MWNILRISSIFGKMFWLSFIYNIWFIYCFIYIIFSSFIIFSYIHWFIFAGIYYSTETNENFYIICSSPFSEYFYLVAIYISYWNYLQISLISVFYYCLNCFWGYCFCSSIYNAFYKRYFYFNFIIYGTNMRRIICLI